VCIRSEKKQRPAQSRRGEEEEEAAAAAAWSSSSDVYHCCATLDSTVTVRTGQQYQAQQPEADRSTKNAATVLEFSAGRAFFFSFDF
jgi:hypothetical protein